MENGFSKCTVDSYLRQPQTTAEHVSNSKTMKTFYQFRMTVLQDGVALHVVNNYCMSESHCGLGFQSLGDNLGQVARWR